MTSSGSTSLIVSARSRHGAKWFEKAKEELVEAGFQLERSVLLQKSMRLETELDKALLAGCEKILIGGGDGTIRSAAQKLLDTPAILGVLPFGTGNAFARDLGIKTDIKFAVEVIRQGHVAQVDVGKAGGEVFLNVASAGLSSLVATRLRRMPKAILGPLAYVIPLLQAVRLVRPFKVRITTHEGEEEFEAFQVVVGNGRYHAGPFLLSENASLDSGRFTAYAVSSENRGVLYKYMYAMLLGKYEKLPEVKKWETDYLKLETRRPKKLVLDGELIGRTPTEFQVIARALRVFAPQGDPEGARSRLRFEELVGLK